jgi:two-component system sensor histidine kinase KdpD
MAAPPWQGATAAQGGKLLIYLGAAPGVGKTYAMLAEGQRCRTRGADVVAALVEAHGRRLTAAMAEGLETVPRRTLSYRGATFTDMDIDAVLARHPQLALVDELAHTNVPGCRNAKRWQDVDELLDAGIDVITTLNIQHLESLSDVTRQVTGVKQHETLPDEIARRADQIELVDMTPEALRRRMVHGNVYPPDRIEAALTHYFRPGNLTALRELALLWLADRVEEGLQRYRMQHGIAAPWETRERIVVGIAGEAGDEAVVRRAARIAARTPGSELLAVHVTRDDGLSDHSKSLDAQRALVASLGGSFHQIPGDDVAEALLGFARAQNATQMVLGASRRGRIATLLTGKSTPTRLARRAAHIDVHLVSRKGPAERTTAFRPLEVFRGRARARRTTAEATALSQLAVSVLSGHGDPPSLLEEIREMFGLAALSLLEWRRNGAGPRWHVMASAGDRPPDDPAADVSLSVTDTVVLAGRGRALSHDDMRVLSTCAVPMVAGLIRRRQDEQDIQAARQAAESHTRSAMLAAPGRQAYEQLEKAEAALVRLANPGTAISPDERVALASRARHAAMRARRIIADLRDLGRLQTGALDTYLRAVDLDEVLAAALEDLGPGGPDIVLSVPEDMPDVIADASLLTRILTSLTAEALHRSPPGLPPALAAASRDGRAEIRVTDYGPPQAQGSEPDSLGFRLARDLTEAMGDTLSCTENQDRGRTVIITLPASRGPTGTHGTAGGRSAPPGAQPPGRGSSLGGA